MSLPPGFLDELRSRVSLAQIVGRKVTWDPRKSNAARGDWWAPCPFHQEKSASFHVDEAKGYYYCFGCHAKGDAVSFLRETENLGFIEAVERLAADAGMAMPERDPAAAARASARIRASPRRWRRRSSSTACSSRPPAPPRRAPISTAAASPRPPATASRSAMRPTAAPRCSST